jgi:hypothetical protein
MAAEEARKKRSLFSGLRKKPEVRKKKQLPIELIEKIFENLSFKEVGEFHNENFWKRKCNINFGVEKKIPYKSWRLTYKIHELVNKRFKKIIKKIFRSFTKYKGDSYEDDPTILRDWEFYREIVSNGRLRKICSLASLQTKFLNGYIELCYKKLFRTYPYNISEWCGDDYEDHYKSVSELILALSPILMKSDHFKTASDFLDSPYMTNVYTPTDTIGEWAEENEDLIESYLLYLRVLYQLFKESILVDIDPILNRRNWRRTLNGRPLGREQAWSFIIHPDYPIDL